MVLDLKNEDDLTPEIRKIINIPDNAKPNYRAYNFIFDDKRHNIWFEAKTEMGDRMGATTARRLFERLLSNEILGLDSPNIEVTVIAQDGAVDRILNLPNLQFLLIRVNKPNADASSPAARRRVLGRLDESHAKRLELRLTKATNAVRLDPSDDIKELAQVASDTGFVTGEAKYVDGHKISLSTEQQPKKIIINIGDSGSFFTRILPALSVE